MLFLCSSFQHEHGVRFQLILPSPQPSWPHAVYEHIFYGIHDKRRRRQNKSASGVELQRFPSIIPRTRRASRRSDFTPLALFLSSLLLCSVIGRRNVAGIRAECFGALRGQMPALPWRGLARTRAPVPPHCFEARGSGDALTRYLESMCDCVLCAWPRRRHGDG